MEKTVNQKAWFLVLPVLLLVAFSAVIPLMTVVNYSVQDTFGNNQFFWAGLEWFEEMLSSERMWNALGRQLMFSAIILAIAYVGGEIAQSSIGLPNAAGALLVLTATVGIMVLAIVNLSAPAEEWLQRMPEIQREMKAKLWQVTRSIEQAKEALKTALQGEDKAKLESALKDFQAKAQKLGEVLYKQNTEGAAGQPEEPAAKASAGAKGGDEPVDADFEVKT